MQNRKMQIKPTLNVKIALNFTANASKCPAQHYLYFERSFRKWDYIYLNGLIFNKNVFFKRECARTRK